MEVGPLVCPSHRAELHVEEGGGGLDPSWWKVSGSWDGGERRMRYGKIIDDRPSSNPGAVQRRKLEMLETHAPGASMRVVHSQSHASWVQDPSASGMNTSISSSRRSVLSSSSSTRVTSFRQWSTNFTQNSANSIGVTQEAVPMITEFGNLQLALNPLDVSFLRTKGNVGRSGSIGSRRPPSRGRRLSTDLPSDSSAGEDHSKTPSPIPKGEGIVRTHNRTNENHTYNVEENEKEVTESKSEWTSSKPVLDADEKSNFTLRLQNVLYRKKSVSSEDIRTGEATEEEVESLEDVEGKWRRGESVRRSLPSSEWKSVTTAVDHSRQRLRSRDPFKSSSVPALGGIASRRESLITAESLQEMKGRLKHRGDGTDSTSKPSKTDSQKTQGEDDDSAKPGPFFLKAASRIVLPETKQLQETLDDRRKSWSVGCKNLGKCIFEEESEGMSNRRRSYAFEFAAEEKSSMEDKENSTGETTMQKSTGNSQKGKLWVDTHPYVQNRVNEVLKKWSAISKEEENKGKEELGRTPRKSLMSCRSVFDERKADNMVKSSTTWLENGDFQPNSEDIQEAEFSQAKTSSGGKTSFMVNAPKSPYKEEMIASSQEKQESSFSVYGDPMEDYISAHGLKPIDWTDRDNKASNEPVKNEVMPASSGISVTFSNTDGENNSRHHYSVTHLENREAETTKMDGSKVRTSKKVEFSKTEVHFAAESGRFHIVETAGKPPPSNNFRRRRRSPTGAMNVDSSRVGMGSQSVTNAMRFGDSPYEMRLLAGSENIDHSFRDNGNEFSNGEGDREVKGIDGKGSSESKLTPSNNMKTFNELVMEEEQDMENIVRKISETENSMLTSTNFLHLGPEEQSEKPRSILRNSTSENVPPWKISVKGLDESETEDSKPKFGGVRLRPVASSIGHLRVSITNNESPEQLSTATIEKDYSCSLSPGQMELQKLLRSLRHVSLTYNDGSTDSNSMDAQVANGGGMEVRISSSSGQSPTTNAILISGESSETSTPLSVAQRVREVEERRQKEMMDKVAAIQKPAPRPSGQFSTRVTLGSTTSSVVAVESQVQRKTSVSQIENMNPVSPKPAKKISTQNNKIARIHNAQGIAPRLSSDGQQHSEVAASSDIEISSHLSENYNKMVQSKEVPNVTCISLGFQDEIKEGLKNGEIKDEVKRKSESSSNCRSNINGLSIPNTNRITAKVAEKNIERTDKSPEGRLYSRTDKYSVTPSSKDVSSAWRQVGTKNKEQDDCTKVDSFPQDIGSLKKGKELKLEMKDKMNENSKIVSLGSLTPANKSFQSDQTSIQRFKDENRFKDMTGQFSIKMKVVKSQAEGKSGTVLDPTFQSNIKSSIQAEQRKTNISNTLSKFSGNESITQRNKRESSPGVSRELKTIAMQASKSPIMEQRNKVSTRSSKSDNPDTASPTTGKVVRKRLRKRGNGSSSKSGSSSDGRKQSKDDESAILEELTKAADEILYAVNGYSDEVSSDEDVEASKTESRTKRRQVSRKEICSKKLSSSSGKDSKSGGSLRNSTQRIKEHRSRVTNGVKSSAEVMQRIIPETQGIDKTNLGSPVSSPSIPACNSRPMVSEKNTKSKQHPPLSICKKIMTRIEPTNRVAEVKLIEKRPPLPPAGQRRPSRNKERSEVLGKGSHGKVKTTTSLVYNKDGEAEVIEELKRPLNIARALEAVMPESRSKTKMIDQKVEVSCALKGSEIQKKLNPTSASSSAQSSPSATLSIDRKKVSSSRDGGKTPRRRAHQTITST